MRTKHKANAFQSGVTIQELDGKNVLQDLIPVTTMEEQLGNTAEEVMQSLGSYPSKKMVSTPLTNDGPLHLLMMDHYMYTNY